MTSKPSGLFSELPTTREHSFEEYKRSGEHMVHRLRDWSPGDVLWGWEIHRQNGSAMGKTYRRSYGKKGALVPRAHKAALSAFESTVEETTGPGAVFCFAARVDSVRTEPRDPADPGEPPLKHATLDKVMVFRTVLLEDD